ncbi:MAG: HypC/HybG/HupF family hydrogenase formation chaperone [Bacteroidota bacterium]
MCLAIPGQIQRIDQSEDFIRKAQVAFGSITKEVYLDMLPEAEEGQYVLVHAGVAVNVINEDEARKTFDYLSRYGGVEEDLLPEAEA